MPLDTTLTSEQQVRYTAHPATSTGQPSDLDGPLRVTIVSGDGTFEAGATDDEVILKSGDAVGDTVFLIEGDADMGEGEVLLPETVTLHVNAAQASNMGGELSGPEPKTPTP